MNKTNKLYIWFALLGTTIGIGLSSCGLAFSTSTPTPMPSYIHYVPHKALNIHLEFDYPSSWILEEITQYKDEPIISLSDPAVLSLPTRLPNAVDSHPTGPQDFGTILISAQPSKPGQTPDTELDLHKQTYSNIAWMTVLDDYKVTIDGHEAKVLEYLIKPNIENDTLMFNRRIFFMVKNQLYEIIYSVPQKERDGKFEQSYEYFFNSLKITP